MIPKKLYKYRAFNVNTLRMITDAEIYYAKPKSFNDPMDCDPSIDIDVDRKSLLQLYLKLKLQDHTKDEARAALSELIYLSSEDGDFRTDQQADAYLTRMVADGIRDMIEAELGSKGLLALSSTWKSPLMWSHYADEHRGICIEYDTTEVPHDELKPVDYRAPRAIKASDLVAWKMREDAAAASRVSNIYYYAKSGEWRYEKEWRDIAITPGAKGADYRITAVFFGLRCDSSVRVAIVKLLNDHRDIKLYQVEPLKDSFKLRRDLVDREEIEQAGVRDPILIDFRNIIWDFEEEPEDMREIITTEAEHIVDG